MSSTSSRLTLAVTAAVAAVSSLVVGDLLLRVVAPVPLQDEVQFYPRQDGAPVVYERNAFGLRSVSMHTRDKPVNTIRIIVLGASTTDEAVRNTKDTWTGLLEARLRPALADAGFNVEVAAYGRGGFTARDLLWWSRRELPSFDPDVVVTLLGVNDLAWKGGPGYTYHDLRLDSVPTGRSLPAKLKWTCQEVSQICRRLRLAKIRFDTWRDLRAGRAITWGAANLPARRAEYQAYPAMPAPVRDPDPIHEFSDAMESLLGFVRGAGMEAVVLGQPVLWKPQMQPDEEAVLWFPLQTPSGPVRANTDWLEREMARYNDVQRAHAVRLGASYLDLDGLIPKTLDYYSDDCHYTQRADAAVADAAVPVVLERVRELLRRRGRLPA